jgi:type II secretory pathway pseudopilin PulG
MHAPASERGFTLFETLVATGILVTALAGVAQIFVLGTQLTRQASASGMALVAAQDKLESLRGLAFAFDALGATVTDPGLEPSPESSLHEDTESYFDTTDEGLVRRWRIATLDDTPPDAITIEVCVFAIEAAERGPQSADACLSTIRARQP